mgnify:CR=1 FL=1
MKKLLPLLLLILIGCSEPEPINMKEMLIKRYVENLGDVYYTKDTNKPYSGTVFSLYDDLGVIKMETSLKDGQLRGPYKSYYKNGQLESEGIHQISNQPEDGTYKWYYENGQLKGKTIIKNGTYRFKKYYENGQLKQEGTQKSDEDGYERNDGSWKSYYENGQLIFDKIYKDGRLISEKSFNYFNNYFDNRLLSYVDTYKDGKLVSKKQFQYFPTSGQVLIELNFNKDGELDGPYKKYHENGQLEEEGTFKDGKGDGTFKFYDVNGQLRFKETLKDGELIDSKEY